MEDKWWRAVAVEARNTWQLQLRCADASHDKLRSVSGSNDERGSGCRLIIKKNTDSVSTTPCGPGAEALIAANSAYFFRHGGGLDFG